MRAASLTFAALPPLLLLVTLPGFFAEHEVVFNTFAWLWVACSFVCLGWSFFIFRRYRSLALTCLVIGAFNVVVVISVPIVACLRMTHRF